MLLSTDGIIPKVAILDFAITKSLPPFMTAATGMDALTPVSYTHLDVYKRQPYSRFRLCGKIRCDNTAGNHP